MKKIDPSLFTQHEHALEKEFELCPECGCELQIKNSKRGAFLGCSNYPHCDYSRPLVHQETLATEVIAGSVCPQCGNELAIKQGRYGIFIGCSNYPECHHIEHQDHDNDPTCPSCHQGHLAQRVSRYGKTFYACDRYPKCKYVVNQVPVMSTCPKCGWEILVEKNSAAGKRLVCPQKRCDYRSEPV